MVGFGEPQKLVPQMREQIADGQGFWLAVTGGSMTPTLRHMRDSVFIVPLDRQPEKGDILLTQAGAHCLLHRVVRREGHFLYYKGDAQKKVEGPLPLNDVIGIAAQVRRGESVFRITPFYHFKSLLKKNIIRSLVFAKCRAKRLNALLRHK